MKKYQDLAILLLRVATAANFLSPVASRLGFWDGDANAWQNFVAYTGEVNSFAPTAVVPLLAVVATTLEVVFALLLLVGYKTRWAAVGASVLTLLFALAMTYSFGVKAPLDYAVFVDCTSAFLLATMPAYRWSLDEWQNRS
ncbi:DoxX family protein [Chryseolinea lacunae]|uniref:DoxX family protein n=1 Tax=Chryseolinea lacunae TaxID=2801331 RepID=A0ABS1KM78_9BACT|nr:DoxX family protein [Chryseolinea lacunae]MBL0740342.1 DoxX family protein [Chryseolinea lacunae]